MEESEAGTEESRTCPQCLVEYPIDTLICTDCGINLVTKQRILTSVGEKKREETPQELTDMQRFMLRFGPWAPGLFSFKVMLFSILMLTVAAGVGFIGMIVFGLGAVMEAILIWAMALLAYAQAVAWILCGQIRLLQNALFEFRSQQWGMFCLVVFGPFFFGFFVMGWAANQ